MDAVTIVACGAIAAPPGDTFPNRLARHSRGTLCAAGVVPP
jgi:hypothetical protein